jgi:hypothetical protein
MTDMSDHKAYNKYNGGNPKYSESLEDFKLRIDHELKLDAPEEVDTAPEDEEVEEFPAGTFVTLLQCFPDFPRGTICLVLPSYAPSAAIGGVTGYCGFEKERRIQSVGSNNIMWVHKKALKEHAFLTRQ